jgi:15-cis-phytoene synthase
MLRSARVEAPRDGILESRRWCRTFLRGHSRSFYLATRFLPRGKREAIEAMYSLFRVVDEIADDARLERDEKYRRLDEVARSIEHVSDAGYTNEAPWFAAVRAAFAGFPIAGADVLRLIAACRAESEGIAFSTMSELEAYAAAIGGAVLRLGVTILGARDADSLARAERLGIGLHFVDIVRDLEEDEKMGRSYLPAELSSLPNRGAAVVAQAARRYCGEVSVLAKRLPNDGSRLTLLLTTDLYESLMDGPLSGRKRLQHVLRSIRKAYTM